MNEIDENMVYDLQLFIENDSDLYRQQYKPILQNLTRKKAAGIYDHQKAVKLFLYLVESGAKKYTREAGTMTPWHEFVNISTRRKIAENLTESFESDYALGAYGEYVPKKYRKVSAHTRSV